MNIRLKIRRGFKPYTKASKSMLSKIQLVINLLTFVLHIYCSMLLDTYKYYFEILDLFDPPLSVLITLINFDC